MARLAGAGELAGTTGLALTPAAVPDRFLPTSTFYLDQIGDGEGNPVTDEEFRAAYDGMTAAEVAQGYPDNPFRDPNAPTPTPRTHDAWPHWRTTLAHERRRDGFYAWCADRNLLGDDGRPPREFAEAFRLGVVPG
ncbi:hypothetical protein [Gordonia sp. HS-NH1]|uniref:hypothetical protein n=1 Tax=Gordonia sp. HS-NH1 TaxID=1435068 RepID=UPI0006E21D32|nr:hypothetical protein [Gordonia sp. HS-NH1]